MDRDELKRRKRRTYVGGHIDNTLPIGYYAEESGGIISFEAGLGGPILLTTSNGLITFTRGVSESDGIITI